jgi:hypothetical protein
VACAARDASHPQAALFQRSLRGARARSLHHQPYPVPSPAASACVACAIHSSRSLRTMHVLAFLPTVVSCTTYRTVKWYDKRTQD